ncbi:class I SAM-dependent DNA methyltransferase [Candidatus Latescibacterota bacterium]
MISSQPYGELAKIYDRVMDHVKYDKWVDYISSIFEKYDVRVTRILEIACGTGNFSLYFNELGYDITCTDLSPDMLKIAAVKFEKHNIPKKLFAADMSSLPLKGEFDAVLCLYDSVNYLLDSENVKKTMTDIYSVLRPGGLFIFDVCTVKNSKLYFADNTMFEELDDIKYERKCSYNDTECIQENVFIVDCLDKNYVERHLQRIYTLKEIEDIISGTLFKNLGIFNDLTFFEGSEDSERVHFVLKK